MGRRKFGEGRVWEGRGWGGSGEEVEMEWSGKDEMRWDEVR